MKIDEEKLYEPYYELDCLCTGGKAIKELHKIMFILRKYIKSWLPKQALWQVHISLPKEYIILIMMRQNLMSSISLICFIIFLPHNIFEGNTYKYILKGIDVASRYKVTRALRTKKSSEVAFLLEAI